MATRSPYILVRPWRLTPTGRPEKSSPAWEEKVFWPERERRGPRQKQSITRKGMGTQRAVRGNKKWGEAPQRERWQTETLTETTRSHFRMSTKGDSIAYFHLLLENTLSLPLLYLCPCHRWGWTGSSAWYWWRGVLCPPSWLAECSSTVPPKTRLWRESTMELECRIFLMGRNNNITKRCINLLENWHMFKKIFLSAWTCETFFSCAPLEFRIIYTL